MLRKVVELVVWRMVVILRVLLNCMCGDGGMDVCGCRFWECVNVYEELFVYDGGMENIWVVVVWLFLLIVGVSIVFFVVVCGIFWFDCIECKVYVQIEVEECVVCGLLLCV